MKNLTDILGEITSKTITLSDKLDKQFLFEEDDFGGDGIATLEVGDKFVIKRAEATTKICKLSEESFLEILRKKMQAYS